MRNQEQVWLQEQAAIQEHRKAEQLRKEIAEERSRRELEALHAKQSGKKVVDRMDWMYPSAAAQTGGRDPEAMEEYLLGKRRIEAVVVADEVKEVVRANTPRDTAAKVRQDPLFEIKKAQARRSEARQGGRVEGPHRHRHRQPRHDGSYDGPRKRDRRVDVSIS